MTKWEAQDLAAAHKDLEEFAIKARRFLRKYKDETLIKFQPEREAFDLLDCAIKNLKATRLRINGGYHRRP